MGEWTSGKEASPPVSWADGFPWVLGTSAGTVTGSGTQKVLAPAVVMGGHERAAGGDGCPTLVCGLGETSTATPRGHLFTITGVRMGPLDHRALLQETVGSHSVTQAQRRG